MAGAFTEVALAKSRQRHALATIHSCNCDKSVAALVLLDSRLPRRYRCNLGTMADRASMSRRRFLVERVGNRWKVRDQDQYHDPYTPQPPTSAAADRGTSPAPP